MNDCRTGLSSVRRVFASLGHREPDRVPLDIGGTTVTGIHADALRRLLESMSLAMPVVLTDTVQQTAVPEGGFPASLGVDTERVGPDRIRGPKSRVVEDAFRVAWERKPGELYYSQVSWPLKARDGLSDALEVYAFPEPDGESLSSLARKAARSEAPDGKGGLFPILDRDCAGLMEMSARLRGTDLFYTDFYTDRAGVEALAEKLLEYKLAYWEAMLGGWDGSDVVVSEADDFGTDISLLVSPEFLAEIYFPRYRKLFSFIRKKAPKARIFFHSCGAVRRIIPDFIEMGVDILNPVQYSARDMDLAGLKKDFGKDLVFWGGGIDTRKIFPFGTEEEVRNEVKRVLDVMAPGGGFVFATVHNIQADVPTRNILAMLETLHEYGRYR